MNSELSKVSAYVAINRSTSLGLTTDNRVCIVKSPDSAGPILTVLGEASPEFFRSLARAAEIIESVTTK